jgi:hypothetical protein
VSTRRSRRILLGERKTDLEQESSEARTSRTAQNVSRAPYMRSCTHPPLSQIPQGSLLFAVNDPSEDSNAQKNRVSFG